MDSFGALSIHRPSTTKMDLLLSKMLKSSIRRTVTALLLNVIHIPRFSLLPLVCTCMIFADCGTGGFPSCHYFPEGPRLFAAGITGNADDRTDIESDDSASIAQINKPYLLTRTWIKLSPKSTAPQIRRNCGAATSSKK